MAPAKKKLTPAQQRDRRSKIILAGLGVVLLAVVGLEVPKFLGGKKSPSAAPAATTSPSASSASLAGAQVVAVTQPGSLSRFGRFAAKDPFHAQVSGEAAGSSKGVGGTATQKTTTNQKPVMFSVRPTATVPAGPLVPAVVLNLNGVRHVITVGRGFPATNPVFTLVSVGRKAMWISLVGGSFSSGSQTLMIARGHPVKLVNTTAGLSYLIRLVKVTSIHPPAAPPATTTVATTTAATTTGATTTAETTTAETTTTTSPPTTTTGP